MADDLEKAQKELSELKGALNCATNELEKMKQERKVKPKKNSKKTALALTLVGEVVLCVAAAVAVPRIFPYATGALNKELTKAYNSRRNEDDWGPVIEKKV